MTHSRILPFFAAVLAALVFLAPVANAGWMDRLKDMGKESGILQETTSTALTNDEIAAGLKEALEVGVNNAVSFLGRTGGYLNHDAVRIPMPEHMQTAAKVAKTMGREELVDEFVTSMNRAAEKAVPEAIDVFMGAIRQMSISDAKNILNGPDDAATQYFEEHTTGNLTERFMPIVQQATDNVGVTRKYKNLTDKLGPASMVMDTDALDLDAYVTDQALEGLFYVVAREEKKIREDPAARTTEILKKVFGNAGQ